MENSIVEKLREYFINCPYLSDGRICIDFLDEKEGMYSIEPMPVNPVINNNIDGSTLKQFVFVFASRESYGQETIQNILNTKFYENFSKWITNNNKNDILPDIAGIESIEVLSSAYAFQTGIDTARYQIQLRITYYEE